MYLQILSKLNGIAGIDWVISLINRVFGQFKQIYFRFYQYLADDTALELP